MNGGPFTSKPTSVPSTEGSLSSVAGFSHACVTMPERIRCWGRFLGNAGVTSSSTALDLHRSPVGVLVDGFSAVASGGGFGGCATSGTARQTLYCWPGPERVATEFNVGGNVSGLWRGSGMGGHRCAITTTGSLRCWGEGSSGQLGQGARASSETPLTALGLLDSPVLEVSVGGSHTCVRQQSGVVRCWGSGAFGQLGHGQSGDGVEALMPVEVLDSAGMDRVTSGYESTCAIKNHHVFCWGRNDQGQLGTGDTIPRNVPTPILAP